MDGQGCRYPSSADISVKVAAIPKDFRRPAFGVAVRTLVLFAHYDVQQTIDRYVSHYLYHLRRLDDTVIVFVSDADRLAPHSTDMIARLYDVVYVKHTPSRDFGSWRLGWDIAKQHGWLDGAERLVLANDSVYGPLFPLHEMWSMFHGADMYGALESCLHQPHLSSFFLAFDLNPPTRAFLEAFWDGFDYISDPDELIRSCEVGLSIRAQEAGLTLKPYVSVQDFKDTYAQAKGHDWDTDFLADEMAPADWYFWWGLIRYHRFPFLKVKLARIGEPICETIEQCTNYPLEWITAHVARVNAVSQPVFRGDSRMRA